MVGISVTDPAVVSDDADIGDSHIIRHLHGGSADERRSTIEAGGNAVPTGDPSTHQGQFVAGGIAGQCTGVVNGSVKFHVKAWL